jgi:hypothetical protein
MSGRFRMSFRRRKMGAWGAQDSSTDFRRPRAGFWFASFRFVRLDLGALWYMCFDDFPYKITSRAPEGVPKGAPKNNGLCCRIPQSSVRPIFKPARSVVTCVAVSVG